MTFGVVVLGVAVATSIIIVRIGAVALEMTGLEKSVARFQALSAFTRAGYTTREAESVVSHPQRRSIVSVLILLGHAGVVTIFAGVVETFGSQGGLDWTVLGYLACLMLALFLFDKVLLWTPVARFLDRYVRVGLQTGFGLEQTHIQELLEAATGWGIVRMEVPNACEFVNKPLSQSRLRQRGMLVLAIQRGSTVVPSPGPATLILPGDVLLAYGRIEEMTRLREGADADPEACPLPNDETEIFPPGESLTDDPPRSQPQ
jgi:hypothetical protein